MLRITRSYRVRLRAYFLIIRGIWLQGSGLIVPNVYL